MCQGNVHGLCEKGIADRHGLLDQRACAHEI